MTDDHGEPSGRLTHVDEHGKAHMVDVTGKAPTRRVAQARCRVCTSGEIAPFLASTQGGIGLIEEARYAGIMAAKRTSMLIPLCHSIRIDGIDVAIELEEHAFLVTAVAAITERTGVEMEALTACAASALVLLQPVLEVDPRASIEELTLWHKSGGRSGVWQRSDSKTMRGGTANPNRE
jgi:cyclic pyranopterin phosphate synthase